MITDILLASILAALAYIVAFMEERFGRDDKPKSTNRFTAYFVGWLFAFLLAGFVITKALDWLFS